ncbi:MAG: hypothetical protein K2Q09_04680, partial [Phycisphaerales bacterium]|nr:hypothetical protein [Phycisphaerales bacterium]
MPKPATAVTGGASGGGPESGGGVPDRGHIATEQRNPRSERLHALSAGGCLDLILDEDRAVLSALQGAKGA